MEHRWASFGRGCHCQPQLRGQCNAASNGLHCIRRITAQNVTHVAMNGLHCIQCITAQNVRCCGLHCTKCDTHGNQWIALHSTHHSTKCEVLWIALHKVWHTWQSMDTQLPHSWQNCNSKACGYVCTEGESPGSDALRVHWASQPDSCPILCTQQPPSLPRARSFGTILAMHLHRTDNSLKCSTAEQLLLSSLSCPRRQAQLFSFTFLPCYTTHVHLGPLSPCAQKETTLWTWCGRGAWTQADMRGGVEAGEEIFRQEGSCGRAAWGSGVPPRLEDRLDGCEPWLCAAAGAASGDSGRLSPGIPALLAAVLASGLMV
eukprot:119430-Pelagomonas_calceolata.AAC.2